MSLANRLTAFRTSFRCRLFVVFTLLTAALSIILGVLYVSIEIRERREYVTSQLHQLAQQLVYSIRLPLYAGDRETLRRFAGEVANTPNIYSVSIISSDGALLANVSHHPIPNKSDTIVETINVFSNPLVTTIEETLTGERTPHVAKIGTVRLERYTSDLARKTLNLIFSSILIAIIFWLVISCICYLVLRRVTKSFNDLIKGITALKDGNYVSVIPVDTDDEPGKAAQEINRMAALLRCREQENSMLNQYLLYTNKSLETEINERIQAEQIVRDSEQKLKDLLDIMPVGIAWSDPSGNIEYLNQFFVERFGYNEDKIRTTDDWFSNAYPDSTYREEIVKSWQDALEIREKNCGYTPMFEARVTCQDGMVRHVITKLTISERRTVIILIDITDREILQEQLIKTQKLESIGILAGGIAHNFNNALTGVLGFISLASKQLDESHNAWMLLQHAERATKRATGIAKQLLTFAKGGTPFKKPVSVRKLVEESIELALNGTKVRAQTQIPESIHSVMADEDQLSQVFSNITINAVQAMPEGGTLSISAENIRLSGEAVLATQNTTHVRITFTDQGHGIPAEEIKNVFDPYYTTKPSNSGLGLASVNSIINKHGGQIQVDSIVDQGTTFTIILPSTGLTSTLCETTKEQTLLQNQPIGSILVMDDEEVIREVAKETFTYMGFPVTTCSNGDEAVAKYRAAYESGVPYMAVILDLTIPDGMGGVEAAKSILAINPAAKLIVSSGYSLDPVMADYRKYGFFAAIAKPYRADELGNKLSLLSG